MKKTKVCVLGLGYIGLPTAAIISSFGYKVYGVDINLEVIDIINSGKIHIIEPGLEQKVKLSVENNTFKAYKTPQPSDIYFICVPTPFEYKSGEKIPDLTYVKEAAKSISSIIKKGDIIILESTCPVGTTKYIYDFIGAKKKVFIWLTVLREFFLEELSLNS